MTDVNALRAQLAAAERWPNWRSLKDAGRTRPDDILMSLGIVRPPVDVVDIARRLGVRVHAARPTNWIGAARTTTTEADIWYVGDPWDKLTRFTIAHELGHVMLHPPGEAFRDVEFVGTQQETEANRFAADLLMPVWMVHDWAFELGPRANPLADAFAVSLIAMQRRLSSMGW